MSRKHRESNGKCYTNIVEKTDIYRQNVASGNQIDAALILQKIDSYLHYLLHIWIHSILSYHTKTAVLPTEKF